MQSENCQCISDLNILELLLVIFMTAHLTSQQLEYAYIFLPNTHPVFSGLLNVIPSVFSGIFCLFLWLLILLL